MLAFATGDPDVALARAESVQKHLRTKKMCKRVLTFPFPVQIKIAVL